MEALTGHTRYRAGFFRRLVLQVQYLATTDTPGVLAARWRDAKVEDLAVLEQHRAQREEVAKAVKH